MDWNSQQFVWLDWLIIIAGVISRSMGSLSLSSKRQTINERCQQ